MKHIKNELQNIISGDGSIGTRSQLKKTQNFLRRYAETSRSAEKQKYLKSEEESCLIDFASNENLLLSYEISESNFISSGAEQRVYRYDDIHVIKLNDSIFYEYWLDYFNNIILHNYFFKATAYEFLGFKIIEQTLYAVVKQEFILATENTNLDAVKSFLEYNHFKNVRNNDYYNHSLGIIFEDLHDENVLFKDGIPYFIDTVFYLTKEFYFK